jgi:hypothetical protein
MIIMKLLFNVADRGDRYEFISANTNELAFAGTTNDIIEVPSWEVYETIMDLLNGGAVRVFVPKDMPVTTDNIYTEELSILESKKRLAVNTARDILYNKVINKLSIKQVFRFFMLYNMLADNGIYITNDNKEEVYNVITQDPDKSTLIDIYNEYISLMVQLSAYVNCIDEYDKTVEAINSIAIVTPEELQTRVNIQSLENVENVSVLMTDNEFLRENEAFDAVNEKLDNFIQYLEA